MGKSVGREPPQCHCPRNFSISFGVRMMRISRIVRNQCFSVGFGIEERGSLHGKESASVLSSPFSRRSNRLFSSTDRSWRADVSCGRPSYTSRWPFDAKLDFMTVSTAFFIASFPKAESRSRNRPCHPQFPFIASLGTISQLFDDLPPDELECSTDRLSSISCS